MRTWVCAAWARLKWVRFARLLPSVVTAKTHTQGCYRLDLRSELPPSLAARATAGKDAARASPPGHFTFFELPGSPFPLFSSPSERGNGAPGGARRPAGAPPGMPRTGPWSPSPAGVPRFVGGVQAKTRKEDLFLLRSNRNIVNPRPRGKRLCLRKRAVPKA
jgi:hypothetical protein